MKKVRYFGMNFPVFGMRFSSIWCDVSGILVQEFPNLVRIFLHQKKKFSGKLVPSEDCYEQTCFEKGTKQWRRGAFKIAQ
jgi:hypothetical protein